MLKKILTSLGSILALIAIAFVSEQLYESWQKIAEFEFNQKILGVLFASAIIYAVSGFLLSSAWNQILFSLHPHTLNKKIIQSIYAKSILAKYIPGNVLQIAGRHVMTYQLGIPHQPLAYASLLEIFGLVSAAASISLIGSSVFGLTTNLINLQQVSLIIVIFIPVLALLFLLIQRYAKVKKPELAKIFSIKFYLNLLIIYLKYIVFFLCAGSILVILVYYFDGMFSEYQTAALFVCFSISWLAGFITPGAPSGIGIRETLLILFIEKIMLLEHAAVIAVLFRMITIAGDIIFLFLARNKSSNSQTNPESS